MTFDATVNPILMKKTIMLYLMMKVIFGILGCGLSELDDLFNNTLGCFLGYCIFIVLRYVFSEKRKKKDLCVAVVSWLLVVGFFVVAYYMGQPIMEAVNVTLEEIKSIIMWM